MNSVYNDPIMGPLYAKSLSEIIQFLLKNIFAMMSCIIFYIFLMILRIQLIFYGMNYLNTFYPRQYLRKIKQCWYFFSCWFSIKNTNQKKKTKFNWKGISASFKAEKLSPKINLLAHLAVANSWWLRQAANFIH